MNEPEWSFLNYNKPNYQEIRYYSAPTKKKKINSLSEVDPELLKTFEKLGISISEQKKLISNYESQNHLLEIERLQIIVKSNLDTISNLEENAKSISEVIETQCKEIRTLKRKVQLADDAFSGLSKRLRKS
jgi:Fe-S cluster assembly scaffold protein SufB